MFDGLLSVIAPHTCVGCGCEGNIICDDCHKYLLPAIPRCYRCQRLADNGRTCAGCRRHTALYAVRAAVAYEETAKQVLWRLKFGRARAGGSAIARIMQERCQVDRRSLIAYIPTATGRVRRRGYDQAALIAHAYARAFELEVIPLLTRTGQLQQRTATRQERLTQLRTAFVVTEPQRVRGRRVVVIDDVVTTGGTLDAAASVLRLAGAHRVEGLVYAQA